MSSGVIYGFAVQGWMVITGRFISGIHTGITQSLTRTYIGESSDKVIQMRKEASLKSDEQSSRKTSSLKYTNFFILFTIAVIGLASGPVLGALASQIPSLDPFRWPGYYLIIHSGLLNIFVMLFFCEKWDDVNRRKKLSNIDRNRLKCQKPDQPIQVCISP
ncbi:PREDICTED: uncharacterized protein LOC109582831 [Amphimedon queenslandica]|uniref:Major facilitator superfamily (MFS) profile domain-containing protein n=1 Tax=Amphimedon queenslandica TaxID=400682 RepID=A0A1X7UMX6_AMPQE|nr:PREDICTED: uncharacterized protein LOC109582831 [Amphimedon queenslandica]|eukprot:XP_019853377.1 PREDICTED: uncharacterized protein LOC109582831 [Amphimedon queenslandica]